ncbi:MAG: hypothetical protein PHV05_07180 [Candidatus Riflebacteria bacterium]|nr:hypothetical protein [Candidatus Riflebacteria bacterium]
MAFGTISFDNSDIWSVETECYELEKKIPAIKECFEWANKAKFCISDPPEADAAQLLGRWTQMASRVDLEMTEAAQLSGNPPEIKMSGNGNFNSITMILNNIASEKAALVKKIRLEQIDDAAWEFEIIVAVRNGAWEYFPTQEKTPIPEAVSNEFVTINSGKPFAVVQTCAPVKASVARESIRYIGYFADQATPAVIIETAGKFFVLKCGEKTNAGSVIKNADADELQLAKTDDNGQEIIWAIKMEKK